MTPRKIIPIAVQDTARAKVDSICYSWRVAAIRDGMQDKFGLLMGDTGTVLQRWYDHIEPALSAVGSMATCHRGCSYCCGIEVQVSELEADLIAQHVGKKIVYLPAKKANRRINLQKASPCPFLKAGECSIYEVRPHACRVHYSVDDDPAWCDFSDGTINRVALVDRRPLDLLFVQLLEHLTRGAGIKHGGRFQDIRQWFPDK